MGKSSRDVIDRMADKFTVGDDCWLWTGAISPKGYGRVRNPDGSSIPQRVLYEAMVGPIPEGHELDHVKERCPNRHCIRPAHMEPVTHDENVRRSSAAEVQRARHARQTHCKWGHERVPGKRCRECHAAAERERRQR